jgi:hypothetical protein
VELTPRLSPADEDAIASAADRRHARATGDDARSRVAARAAALEQPGARTAVVDVLGWRVRWSRYHGGRLYILWRVCARYRRRLALLRWVAGDLGGGYGAQTRPPSAEFLAYIVTSDQPTRVTTTPAKRVPARALPVAMAVVEEQAILFAQEQDAGGDL